MMLFSGIFLRRICLCMKVKKFLHCCACVCVILCIYMYAFGSFFPLMSLNLSSFLHGRSKEGGWTMWKE